ncbi:hypothetical protein [Nonomuraea sp. GTA35]|uniref:hypothetical protein n=1 Tax=Nonomuraea sp. GTA35 TaxID=1676746 RepID=UPI0035BFDECF
MDSESLAAAGLLEALSRASEILAELRHPFVRSEHFSFFFPPAGVRVGTTFMLPDGREVRFEVSIAASGKAFHVEGGIQAEEETLLELPRRSVPDIETGLAAFDDYAGEVAAPAERLIEQLLEELSDN